ncbi:MAG: GntR family transcriptional regulator [Clostridia bacterium]|nr:GntR family transcriptional regulator [Clostridia bacterium]NCC68491.1 GntR family transcriptional regulator [Clostridia bacterium]
MITFENFFIEDGSPIYMQIIRHIKRGVVAGTIQNLDEMPSRRVLSARLGVNPNTVQKAYRMLEEEHIIESHSGAKSYVMISGAQVGKIREQLLESSAQATIRDMKQMGVSKEAAIDLIDRLWE